MHSIDFLSPDAFRTIEALLERDCYLRELAELLGLPPSSVHNTVKKLLAEKILNEVRQKNKKVFGLNYNSPLTREALAMLFTKKILDSVAFKKLVAHKPIGVYLFGTAASGMLAADSDIDLAVYFGKKPGGIEISGIKRMLSNELKREVQLMVLTKDRIASMKNERSGLLSQIKTRSITLWGDELE